MRIQTGFHRFTEIGQIFKNDSKSSDMAFLKSENLKNFSTQTLGDRSKIFHGSAPVYHTDIQENKLCELVIF